MTFTLHSDPAPAPAAAEAPPAVPVPNAAQKVIERHGLEWLAPLFHEGNTNRLMTVKQAARVLQHSPRHVYDLVAIGKLETIKSGHDLRIVKRSLIAHLWDSWSGRHSATVDQLTTFIVLLLPHLPVKAMNVIRETCAHLTARKVASEHALGLHHRPAKARRGEVQREMPLG
jgi:excisionase family DNA binding protein